MNMYADPGGPQALPIIKWASALALGIGMLLSLFTPPESPQKPLAAIAAAERHAVLTGAPFNFTAAMQPFWAGYRDLLVDAEAYEAAGWFGEVDNAGRAIGAMWEALPPPGAEADAVYEGIKEGIWSRNVSLENARVEFDGFLAARHTIIRDLIGNSSMWRQAIDKRFPWSKDPGTENMFQIKEHFTPTHPNATITNLHIGSPEETHDPATLTALTDSAKRLMGRLMQTHHDLWEQQQGDLRLASAGRVHAAAALEAEAKFLPLLKARVKSLPPQTGTRRRKPSRRNAWKPAFDGATARLRDRLEALRVRHEEMAESLALLRARFEKETAAATSAPRGSDSGFNALEGKGVSKPQDNPKTQKQELLAWASAARDMLTAWATLLLDVQEGVVLSLRRRDFVDPSLAQLSRAQSWTRWKRRNCGATTCYAPSGLPFALWWAVGGRTLAFTARYERAWNAEAGDGRVVNVWRGVYDKACCEDGELAQMLEWGTREVVGKGGD
ncbi:hypothetical protein F5B20DRAFT_213034 [Whalleya microplaca]|nr:hypothetical protein F5B20DRAFT_213034 [Whalleya microplaca]